MINRPSSAAKGDGGRSEEHTSELQSHLNLVCRLLLEKKKKANDTKAAAKVATRDDVYRRRHGQRSDRKRNRLTSSNQTLAKAVSGLNIRRRVVRSRR